MRRTVTVIVLAVALVGVGVLSATVLARQGDTRLDPDAAEQIQREFDEARIAEAEERAAAEKAAITLAVQRPADRPMRILFVGDSLTAGYYATTARQSFVARVVRGIGGDVDVLGGQQVANGHGKTADVARVDEGADLAVIELGTDDVEDGDPKSFGRDYRALLDMVKASSPGVPVLCLGVWHPFPGDYDGVIEDACRERGGIFVSLSAIEADPKNHGPEGRPGYRGISDAFHPNDLGHRRIAAAVLYQLDVL